jgi:hypothetical protein
VGKPAVLDGEGRTFDEIAQQRRKEASWHEFPFE